MSNMGTPNKYVCPNDRQLALRAKLRSGWSVPRSVSPLTPAEQAAILEVIRRSEALGQAEARRVGRLVDRVEALKRSAAGAVPTGVTGKVCRLCGHKPSMLSPLRVCKSCNRTVCCSCCVHSSTFSDQWLCNLCAETREMWKKSGAWFYKGLPQYILPERKSSGRYGETRLAASLQDVQTISEEPPDTPPPLFFRQMSAAESRRSIFQDNAETEVDGISQGISGLSLTRVESFKTYNGLRRTSSKESARSFSSLQHSNNTNSQSNTVGGLNKDSSNGYSNQRNSSSSGSTSGSSIVTIPPVSLPINTGCGTAEVRLHHNQSEGILHCTAVRARDLPSTDLAGLADPYCCLEILPPNGTSSNRQRTKTIHKTRNPEFNETVTFYGVTETDIGKKTFRITLLDEDKYGCDILGSASISLKDALCGKLTQDITLRLVSETQICESLMKPQILVSLSYNTKKRSLAVGISRCRNLPSMDSNGYSDPFVKLHLEPDPHHRKHKTSIKWRNLNPVFNEEFLFETRPTELSKQSLVLTVWDKDYGKPNDFLGSLVIGYTSKGNRLKHWLDCIKFPDHRHEQWHCLTEAIP